MKYIKRDIVLILEAIFLIALFVYAVFLDEAFAISLFWQFYLVIAFFALLLVLPGFLSSQRKQALWLFLSFNFGLFGLHFLTLNPVKPFTQFYLDINNGMTIQEVERLFSQRFPKGGRFRQPIVEFHHESPVTSDDNDRFLATPNQWQNYILDPTDGRYNSEILIVYFKDGKVVGTEYLPD